MNAKSVKPNEGHFLIIEDDKGKNVVPLRQVQYAVGRAKECDIRIRSQFVSRRHATLLRRWRKNGKAYYQIIDGDSQGNPSVNGLLVNGHKVSACDLENGDTIIFGPQASAVYQLRRYDLFPTLPTEDPSFDITLIDPAMMNDQDELS
ncbi:MAG: FHA domain-containing protein [Cyanophyceae cyanobacterium]